MPQHSFLFTLGLILTLLAMPARAQDFETSANAAIILDQTTGIVLFEKNADLPLPPASMSKLMTIYLAFEAVATGRFAADDRLPVSQHAMSMGGSSMFLNTTDRVRFEDLMRGTITQSGNDSAVVIAEALSPDGTEEGFARLMTQRGIEIGLTQSTFRNASGLPAPGHVMSVRDLSVLANRIITDYPTFYPLFAEPEFAFDGRVPSNTQSRNPLLGLGIGDGLKTGFTTEAGYGLVGSSVQGGRRIVFVLSGMESIEERRREAERVVTWAFGQFSLRDLGTAGTRITEAPVWMGEKARVGLVLADDLSILVPVVAASGGATAHAEYHGPIPAPITAGQPLGELVIRREGMPDLRVQLVAETDVEAGGFVVRMQTTAQILLRRAMGTFGAIVGTA